MSRFFIFSILICFLSACITINSNQRNGIDVFFNGNLDKYADSGVAVVANRTSVNKNGVNLADLAREHLNLVAIFTPEHGFFGNREAGEKIQDGMYKDIPVHSLYGKNKKPTENQLMGVDIIVFDMQDIGSRYYTYVSTMGLVMESAAENQIQLIVLDRPNPLGKESQGPVLDLNYSSFVGMYPIPIRHGLTIGEIAQMINGMGWIKTDNILSMDVIELEGWSGEYVKINLPPSPNIPDLETAILYNGLCLLEGTNLSEGRGTDFPFKVLGAPWLDSQLLLRKIFSARILGLRAWEVSFTPKSIPGKASYPKYDGELCRGIQFEVADRDSFHPLSFAVFILKAIRDIHPDEFKFLDSGFINNLYGSENLKKNIISGASIEQLVLTWSDDLDRFENASKSYRIYR